MHVLLGHNPGAGAGQHDGDDPRALITKAGHTLSCCSAKDERRQSHQRLPLFVAAIECAFVAAGLALVRAACGEVRVQDGAAGIPLDRLTDHSSAVGDLRHWHAPLALSDRMGVALLTGGGSVSP